MKQTLPAKLIAQFEKLSLAYTEYDGNIPLWLTTAITFLEDYRHDSAVTMKQIARNWHRINDSASMGNWAEQMTMANEEYRVLTLKE